MSAHQGVDRWAVAVEVTFPRCPSLLWGESGRQNVSVSLRLFSTESGSPAPTLQKCKASRQVLHWSGRTENTFPLAGYAGRVAAFPTAIVNCSSVFHCHRQIWIRDLNSFHVFEVPPVLRGSSARTWIKAFDVFLGGSVSFMTVFMDIYAILNWKLILMSNESFISE